MASELAMSTHVFVIDTSYLLELFRVPHRSDEIAIEEVRNRYERAIESKSRLYVPLPCIFEFANHVAHVSDGNKRKQLAKTLYKTIKSCVEEYFPWNITASTGIDDLPRVFGEFAHNYVIEKIGLTDTVIIEEANPINS